MIGLAYYIYHTLYVRNDLQALTNGLELRALQSRLWLFLIALLLVIPNWLIEAYKWRQVINEYNEISVRRSVLSILAGLTLGIITPARTGEYVGRLSLLRKEQRPEALLSTFLGSVAQNVVTILIGIVCFIIFYSNSIEELEIYGSVIRIIAICLVVLGLVVYYKIAKLMRWLGRFKFLKKHLSKFREHDISYRSLSIILFYSFCRYFIYLIQYVCILKFFGLEGNVQNMIIAIPLIYLLQSLIPLPPLSGLVARGEIAVLVLSTLDNNLYVILLSALTVWVINLILPALGGLIVVFDYNNIQSESKQL